MPRGEILVTFGADGAPRAQPYQPLPPLAHPKPGAWSWSERWRSPERSALLASRLQLKTAFSELLPSNDPGVMTLTRTQKRMGDMSLLLIGVRSPDYAANLRYAEALTQKLRALPPTVVNLATYDVRDLRAFYEKNKWLFVSEDDLESIRDRLRNEISKRKNPLFVSLDEEEPIDKMQKRHRAPRRSRRALPGRHLQQQQRRVRLDRRAAAGRAVRRARRASRSTTPPTS